MPVERSLQTSFEKVVVFNYHHYDKNIYFH